MDDLREELYDAIVKAEQAFADDVTAAMAKRATAVAAAIAEDKRSFDLRMATFNGMTPLKEPVITETPRMPLAAVLEASIENELDPLPSVVTHRTNGAQS